MIVHATETATHTSMVTMLLERQAYTEEPYRNTFRSELLPMMAAAPMMGIPVPMKKEAATETPK